MRLPSIALLLCLPLPLLTGCPDSDTGDEGAADSTTNEDPTAAEDPSSTTQTSPTEETSTTSPGETETETDTAPPDTDTDTDDPIVGCECILDEDPADLNSAPAAPTCGEELCPHVAGACTEDLCELGAPFELDDPAALECALMALRDRTPGIVTWSRSEATGLISDNGYVLVNEDGSAVRRNWLREDLNFVVSDAVLGELPTPEAYDACLADPDDLARFDCLVATHEVQLGVCDEGWVCSDCI